MITLFDTVPLDSTVVAIAGFVYILAFVAIYKMHDIKEGLLFFLFITAAALMIFIFMRYSMISALVVLLYIGNLVYSNFRSEP
jgi:hypothetical protein